MKFTKLFLGCVLASILVSTTVFATDKIALVSIQQAMHQVDDGKKAMESLKKEYEKKKTELDAIEEGLKKQFQDFDSQRAVLSKEALETKGKELQAKSLDLQNKKISYERDLRSREAESAQKIIATLRDVVIEITKKEGYTLVLENSSETVLFAANGEDITSKVVSAYNTRKK